jgi:hypothetical protein
MPGAKTNAERFAAGHKLSARHPMLFGVSPWTRKLASIQTGKTIHEKKWLAWSCQIYQETKAEKASVSTRPSQRRVDDFIEG